jgi:hypothetical protein
MKMPGTQGGIGESMAEQARQAQEAIPKIRTAVDAYHEMITRVTEKQKELETQTKQNTIWGPTDAEQKMIERLQQSITSSGEKLDEMLGNNNPVIKYIDHQSEQWHVRHYCRGLAAREPTTPDRPDARRGPEHRMRRLALPLVRN